MQLKCGESYQNPIKVYDENPTNSVFSLSSAALNYEYYVKKYLDGTFGADNGSYSINSIHPNWSPLMSREKFTIVQLRTRDNIPYTLFFQFLTGPASNSGNGVDSVSVKTQVNVIEQKSTDTSFDVPIVDDDGIPYFDESDMKGSVIEDMEDLVIGDRAERENAVVSIQENEEKTVKKIKAPKVKAEKGDSKKRKKKKVDTAV